MFHTKFILILLSETIRINQHQIITKTLTPNELITAPRGREAAFTSFYQRGTGRIKPQVSSPCYQEAQLEKTPTDFPEFLQLSRHFPHSKRSFQHPLALTTAVHQPQSTTAQENEGVTSSDHLQRGLLKMTRIPQQRRAQSSFLESPFPSRPIL